MTIAGYKRFEERSSLVAEHRVNAVVGRNEAGKTSLLSALLDLNSRSRLPHGRLTRDSEVPLEVVARFSLDASDHEALASIPEAAAVRWLTVTRTADGRIYELDRRPMRDLRASEAAIHALDSFRDDFVALADDPESVANLIEHVSRYRGEDEPPEAEDWDAVAGHLRSILSAAEDRESGDGSPESLAFRDSIARADDLLRRVVQATDAYSDVDPNDAAIEVLAGRVPEFLLFTEDDRNLQSEYQLLVEESPSDEEVAPTRLVPAEVPAALANLARLAKLEIDELRGEMLENRDAEAQTRINRANREMQRRLGEDWGQSKIECELKLKATALQVFIRSEGSDALFTMSDRSAGLTNFIALQAFVCERTDHRPILLIDEVETHLHYDAQVDLIEVLSDQTTASQVIYTTHSIGALPPDLISGLSAVMPVPGSNRSAIDGSIWTHGPALGLTPLLVGMGAKLLALVVPTTVVLTEGASDSILLPRLLRSVSKAPIGFRFAPGLAGASRSVVQTIDTQAARVVCVVDGDAGGADLLKQLTDWGVASDSIFSIGALSPSAITVEDFLSPEAIAAGVNEHLRRWRDPVELELDSHDVPTTGKWEFVAQYCSSVMTKPPGKPQLAQTLIDLSVEGAPWDLVDAAFSEALTDLGASIRSKLET